MLLDKGGDYEEGRATLQAHGLNRPHPLTRRGKGQGQEKEAGSERPRSWVVERPPAWFNRFRSLLARWCKKARNDPGVLCFVRGLISYRATGLFGWAVTWGASVAGQPAGSWGVVDRDR